MISSLPPGIAAPRTERYMRSIVAPGLELAVPAEPERTYDAKPTTFDASRAANSKV